MTARRAFLSQLAGAAALAAGSASVAEPHPARIVVGFAAGGTADLYARLLAAHAAEHLKRPVIVDNRPGAAAIIGADHVAKSTADGNTLLLTFADALTANVALYRDLPYRPERDFRFIAQLAAGPLVIAAGAALRINNLATLRAAAAQRPLSWGSWGAGSHGHLLCAALTKAYGLDLLHVPYKGEGPAIQDLLGGQIHLAAGSIGAMAPHLASGKLAALGVIGRHRAAALREVPTLTEQGALDEAFILTGWVGLVAPAALSDTAAAQWQRIVESFLAQPATRQRFAERGFEPAFLDGAAFRKRWAADLPVWTRLVREARVSL